MFCNDDESSSSDDDANEVQGVSFMHSTSLREEVQPTESNEGSSIRGAGITNGGRPQRKTKSKIPFTTFSSASQGPQRAPNLL